MLNVNLNEANRIAILTPDGKLSQNDFEAVAKVIDPYIEKAGELNGIIVHVKSFPGWDSFGAFVKHLKFVREHHKKISRVAMATDSPMGNFAEHIASHFVNAAIKHFSFDQLEDAEKWILNGVKQ